MSRTSTSWFSAGGIMFLFSSVFLVSVGSLFGWLVIRFSWQETLLIGVLLGLGIGFVIRVEYPRLEKGEMVNQGVILFWLAIAIGFIGSAFGFGFSWNHLILGISYTILHRYASGARPVILYWR